ncbi:MAG: amidohydrolase [Pseudomonadota bacterium]
MFDDDRGQIEVPDVFAETRIPRGHTSDPFACPCCANVFAEMLRLAGINLGNCHLEPVRPAQSSDLLLTNARILTMDPAVPVADSMLVSDGRIVWVGQATESPPDTSAMTRRIDAGGRFVMPGFVEPHMHLAPLAMLRSFENVGPFRFPTTGEAIEHLATVAARTPPGEWVIGRQFDPSLQTGPQYLTAEMLDRASVSHPVFVYNASLHLAYCNSVALKLAGLTKDTPDPPGAELGRTPDGSPNGVLKAGPAMALVGRHNPSVKNQNLAEECLGVFEHAASLGITMMCDQGTGLFQGPGELELYRTLRDSNRMATRFRYCVANPQAERWDQLGIQWGEGDEWVRRTGWKIVSDGSNQGRTGLQRDPFLGSDERGIAYIEPEALVHDVTRRLAKGWAVCVHANGDLAIDRALDAFEAARKAGFDPAPRRCRIEHCSILHDEQLDRMAELGISPSFLIGHVYYWGKAFVNDVFGLSKAEKLDRTGACEARGIRWTIHSDDPVTEMGPLRCIENAVTRSMWKSDELLAPAERVSVDAALRAMTIDAAWQCHSDHEIGSLTQGKLADFVILSADPREVPTDTISQIEVLETWVAGEQVYASPG